MAKKKRKSRKSIWSGGVRYYGIGGVLFMLLLGGLSFFITTLYAIPLVGLSTDGTLFGDLIYGVVGFLLFSAVFLMIIFVVALISKVINSLR